MPQYKVNVRVLGMYNFVYSMYPTSGSFFKGPGDLSYFFTFMVDRIISLLNLDSLRLTINLEKSVVTLAITV